MEPNKKIGVLGIVGALSLLPGYYGVTSAIEFFYTRREALIQVQRIDELRDEKILLYEKLSEIDKKVSRIQGLLEAYLAVRQAQKSRVLSTNNFVKNANKKGG